MSFYPERRIKPRIICDYPAIVVGCDREGIKYRERAKLANLSASGLFMKANRIIDNGSALSVIILLTSERIHKNTPKIGTNGVVVRTEPKNDGTCGVAVKFNSYRFQ